MGRSPRSLDGGGGRGIYREGTLHKVWVCRTPGARSAEVVACFKLQVIQYSYPHLLLCLAKPPLATINIDVIQARFTGYPKLVSMVTFGCCQRRSPRIFPTSVVSGAHLHSPSCDDAVSSSAASSSLSSLIGTMSGI